MQTKESLRIAVIGAGPSGIAGPEELQKICPLGQQYHVPVWLEGGVGSLDELRPRRLGLERLG